MQWLIAKFRIWVKWCKWTEAVLNLYVCVNSKHALKQWCWINVASFCSPLCWLRWGSYLGVGGKRLSKMFIMNGICFQLEPALNILMWQALVCFRVLWFYVYFYSELNNISVSTGFYDAPHELVLLKRCQEGKRSNVLPGKEKREEGMWKSLYSSTSYLNSSNYGFKGWKKQEDIFCMHSWGIHVGRRDRSVWNTWLALSCCLLITHMGLFICILLRKTE